MNLKTSRTYLREFKNSDLNDLTALLADPEVMRFSMNGAMTREASESLLKQYLENYQLGIHSPWAVIYQEKFIGFAGFDLRIVDGEEKVQITFSLMHDYWGQGLATEISKALLDYAFNTLKLKEVIAIVDPKNTASIHTLEKTGMAYLRTVNYQGLELAVYSVSKV